MADEGDGMKLHKIRWKRRASKQDKAGCLYHIEWVGNGFVVPMRSNGSHAISAMRARIWLVLL
jgi:hypothetical protein